MIAITARQNAGKFNLPTEIEPSPLCSGITVTGPIAFLSLRSEYVTAKFYGITRIDRGFRQGFRRISNSTPTLDKVETA